MRTGKNQAMNEQSGHAFDSVLKRMLGTPPELHKAKPEKAKPKANRKLKTSKKRPT